LFTGVHLHIGQEHGSALLAKGARSRSSNARRRPRHERNAPGELLLRHGFAPHTAN
jgi:hypothetical protein